MRRGFVTLAAGLARAAPVAAPIDAPESLAPSFRLEWQVSRNAKGPAIVGDVYNQAARSAERMRLVTAQLDNAGQVAGRTIVWVLGVTSMSSRSYFRARVAEAASDRVRVLTFDWTYGGAI